MRHVLVATVSRPSLVDELRVSSSAATTFIGVGAAQALERLSRSARIDAVVTDDPALVVEIAREIPGTLPVYLISAGEDAAAVLKALDGILTA